MMNGLIQNGAHGIFYILVLFFVIQSIFFGYHWFKYGSSKNISTIALAIFLSGGAILLLTLSLALTTL